MNITQFTETILSHFEAIGTKSHVNHWLQLYFYNTTHFTTSNFTVTLQENDRWNVGLSIKDYLWFCFCHPLTSCWFVLWRRTGIPLCCNFGAKKLKGTICALKFTKMYLYCSVYCCKKCLWICENNFFSWAYDALKHEHCLTFPLSFFFFCDPQHLQKQDSAFSPESCVYYCTLCDYSTKARLNLVQHARSARHQQNEGLRKLQLHQQGLGGDEDGLSLHELFHVKECPSNQGLCFFLCLSA